MTGAPSTIDIQIGVIEVEGLDRSAAFDFQLTVERELARLVSDKGLPAGLSASRSIDAISLGWDDPPPETCPSAGQLAQRIYAGLEQ